MAGCLENCRMPNMEWLEIENRRNLLASIISGILVNKKTSRCIWLKLHVKNYFQFFGGWWFAIDAAAIYTDKENQMKDVFHICGVFGTLSFFMWVNELMSLVDWNSLFVWIHKFHSNVGLTQYQMDNFVEKRSQTAVWVWEEQECGSSLDFW